jgi:hypothetical protein
MRARGDTDSMAGKHSESLGNPALVDEVVDMD